MRIIAAAIAKGGTGKTTTVVNLGHGLAMRGKRVLLVDCDTQSHLATYWGKSPRPGFTIAEVLEGKRKAAKCLVEVRPGLFLLGSDRQSLAGAKMAMGQDALGMGAFWLRDHLADLTGFDFCLLDTAPSWDILSMGALLACQEVIIPISTEYLSLASAAEHVNAIEDVKRHNAKLRISVILPTFVDGRTARSLEILDLLRQTFGRLLAQPIRINSDLSAAASFHKSIFEYAPKSRGAGDYKTLVERVEG